MRKKVLVWVAVGVLGILLAATVAEGQAGYIGQGVKSKGQYSTALTTTSVNITPDSGYLFREVLILNDDAANNLFVTFGATSIAGTGGSTADFFLKPGESLRIECYTGMVTVEASGASTDYRFFGTEVPR